MSETLKNILGALREPVGGILEVNTVAESTMQAIGALMQVVPPPIKPELSKVLSEMQLANLARIREHYSVRAYFTGNGPLARRLRGTYMAYTVAEQMSHVQQPKGEVLPDFQNLLDGFSYSLEDDAENRDKIQKYADYLHHVFFNGTSVVLGYRVFFDPDRVDHMLENEPGVTVTRDNAGKVVTVTVLANLEIGHRVKMSIGLDGHSQILYYHSLEDKVVPYMGQYSLAGTVEALVEQSDKVVGIKNFFADEKVEKEEAVVVDPFDPKIHTQRSLIDKVTRILAYDDKVPVTDKSLARNRDEVRFNVTDDQTQFAWTFVKTTGQYPSTANYIMFLADSDQQTTFALSALKPDRQRALLLNGHQLADKLIAKYFTD